MRSHKFTTRRIAILALFVAFALIMFLIENLFPSVFPFAPGAKLGLGNIFVLLALLMFGFPEAVLVLVSKCIISMLFYGNFFSILYSFVGGGTSLIAMWLVMKIFFPKVSIIGISIIGGVIHNLGQLIVASFVINSFTIFYYFPLLAIAGTLAGIVVGLLIFAISKRVTRLSLE